MYVILSYDDWFNALTDKEVEELERTRMSFDEAYSDYVSYMQDMAYNEYKDDILMCKD